MVTFAFRRLIGALPVLALVVVLIFSIVRLLPGDPAVTLLGEGATNAQIAALRTQLRLDEPLLSQLVGYVAGLLRGDLGDSLRTGTPVTKELLDRLPATLELTLFALVLALIVGVPIGTLSAVWPNSLLDHLTRLAALVGVSAPVFWIALFLQIIFGLYLDLVPISGRLDAVMRPPRITGLLVLDGLILGNWSLVKSALLHLVLPASVLTAFLSSTLARLIRVSLLDQLSLDYIRTARAKGLHEYTIVLGHGLRNAILPAVTVVGLKLAELLGGAILTETVFAWPGMGRYMFEAIKSRDYPVIQGCTLVFALLFIGSSLLVDLLYGVLNPQIRLES